MEQPLCLMTAVQYRRLQTSRSPVESPPVAKKFLRSSCPVNPHQPTSVLTNVDSKESTSRSILKRDDYNRSRSWHAGHTQRTVDFDETVVVVVYDRADGQFVCCENQQLNTTPRDRQQFISRSMRARLHSNKSTMSTRSFDEDLVSPLAATGAQVEDAGRRSSADTHLGRPLPSVQLHRLHDTSLPPVSSLDFTFHEDHSGQLRLRFTVALGRGVAAGDALVKANIAGNKVRVLGTRTVTNTGLREDFATRYALPMDVDPYSISARLDSAGNLFVEARVVTGHRHQTTTDC